MQDQIQPSKRPMLEKQSALSLFDCRTRTYLPDADLLSSTFPFHMKFGSACNLEPEFSISNPDGPVWTAFYHSDPIRPLFTWAVNPIRVSETLIGAVSAIGKPCHTGE